MPTTMLRKVLPKRLKTFIKEAIRREVETHLTLIPRDAGIDLGTIRQEVETHQAAILRAAGIDLETIRRDVETGLRDRGYVEAIWPHQPGSRCYMIPKTPEKTPEKCLHHESSSLPIPPKDLWLGYGQTVEEFLALGEEHIRAMREMLEQKGSPIESAGRIMEFGCATGRMIRWLHDLSDSCEIWGTDISSGWITWCKQYLSPPFHFATTTTSPHLPFEDRYFGLIYVGSVFTHIDDLADAWFMELRRTLRPGGRLYITVHDQVTIEKLKEWPQDNWLVRFLHSCPEYEQYCRSDFGMFTIGRSVGSQVFYDVDYLSQRLKPFFRTLAVKVGAYGQQTGILFERL